MQLTEYISNLFKTELYEIEICCWHTRRLTVRIFVKTKDLTPQCYLILNIPWGSSLYGDLTGYHKSRNKIPNDFDDGKITNSLGDIINETEAFRIGIKEFETIKKQIFKIFDQKLKELEQKIWPWLFYTDPNHDLKTVQHFMWNAFNLNKQQYSNWIGLKIWAYEPKISLSYNSGYFKSYRTEFWLYGNGYSQFMYHETPPTILDNELQSIDNNESYLQPDKEYTVDNEMQKLFRQLIRCFIIDSIQISKENNTKWESFTEKQLHNFVDYRMR